MPNTPLSDEEKSTLKIVMLNIYERIKNYPVFMAKNMKKSIEPSVAIANQLTEPEAIKFMREREEDIPRDLSDNEKLSLIQFSCLGTLYQFVLHTKITSQPDSKKSEVGDLLFFEKGIKVLTLHFETPADSEATEENFTITFSQRGDWTNAMTQLLQRMVAIKKPRKLPSRGLVQWLHIFYDCEIDPRSSVN